MTDAVISLRKDLLRMYEYLANKNEVLKQSFLTQMGISYFSLFLVIPLTSPLQQVKNYSKGKTGIKK